MGVKFQLAQGQRVQIFFLPIWETGHLELKEIRIKVQDQIVAFEKLVQVVKQSLNTLLVFDLCLPKLLGQSYLLVLFVSEKKSFIDGN